MEKSIWPRPFYCEATMTSFNLVNPNKVDPEFIQFVKDKYEKRSLMTVLYRVAVKLVTLPRLTGVNIHYISDNGDFADLAKPEITGRLTDASRMYNDLFGVAPPPFSYSDIPAQDVYAAAFDIAQLSRTSVRGAGNVFFVNCAPRKKQRGQEKNNGGEKTFCGMLPNGAIVMGTGEDVFVHFKDLIAAGKMNVYETTVATAGSQFRSRDFFPWGALIVGRFFNQFFINLQWRENLSTEARDKLLFRMNIIKQGSRLSPDQIAAYDNEGSVVARVDVHGNVKMAIRHEQFVEKFGNGGEVVVFANGKILNATVTTGSFDKTAGNTVISAGSSGEWQTADGKAASPFAEIFTVGGRARIQLGLSDDDIKNGASVFFVKKALFDQAKSLVRLQHPTLSDSDIYQALIEANLIVGLNNDKLVSALATPDTFVRSLNLRSRNANPAGTFSHVPAG
jgi:hypothetical protein